jgi:hypothetical protein
MDCLQEIRVLQHDVDVDNYLEKHPCGIRRCKLQEYHANNPPAALILFEQTESGQQSGDRILSRSAKDLDQLCKDLIANAGPTRDKFKESQKTYLFRYFRSRQGDDGDYILAGLKFMRDVSKTWESQSPTPLQRKSVQEYM